LSKTALKASTIAISSNGPGCATVATVCEKRYSMTDTDYMRAALDMANQALAAGEFQYDGTTQVMTIPLRGATSVQIRR